MRSVVDWLEWLKYLSAIRYSVNVSTALNLFNKSLLKDNLPHNTCQIYVKPQSKNTQMTLECQIFDEKALR